MIMGCMVEHLEANGKIIASQSILIEGLNQEEAKMLNKFCKLLNSATDFKVFPIRIKAEPFLPQKTFNIMIFK